MLRKMTRNDMKRNRFITVLLILFIMTATTLVSCAFGMVLQLTGSINNLMETAKTPDFLQMHSGEIDKQRIMDFAKKNPDIASGQILDYLNVEGSEIRFKGTSLADSVQDNGFSVQSSEFDFLLNMENQKIEVKEGEIYVPIRYMEDYKLEKGDKLSVCGIEFQVAGGLRDSQMNSSLSSSKRFLVNEADYEKLLPYGSLEYLIEFFGVDHQSSGKIEAAYSNASLEANGPAITRPLFYMINAISDGILIVVILLLGCLIVLISFLCIRFTLMTKIEDDYREIGIMKALGMSYKEIRSLYVTKYRYLALAGGILGFLISIPVRSLMASGILLYMGPGANPVLCALLGLLGAVLLYLWVVHYAKKVLKQTKKITAADALRDPMEAERRKGKASKVKWKGLSLVRTVLPTNFFLAVQDVWKRAKIYITLFLVLVFCIFLMFLPQNIYQTISSERFEGIMGCGPCDARIDLQQLSELSKKEKEVEDWIANDPEVSEYAVYVTRKYEMKTESGEIEKLKVDLGPHDIFEVEYMEGRQPKGENEIAISYLNSNELEKKIGDTLSVKIKDEWRTLTVCGIYTDITNGGKTAKAAFSDDSEDIMWYSISIAYRDGVDIPARIDAFQKQFDYGKVSEIRDIMAQTLGSIVGSIRSVSILALVLALAISALITGLFLKMLLAKDQYSIAVMRALGFGTRDIQKQYIFRCVIVLVLALIVGVTLSNTLGPVFGSLMLSGLGIGKFRFIINPWISYLLYPVLILAVVLLSGAVGTGKAGKIKIAEKIRE